MAKMAASSHQAIFIKINKKVAIELQNEATVSKDLIWNDEEKLFQIIKLSFAGN